MFALRKPLCEALGRGIRLGTGPVSVGSRVVGNAVYDRERRTLETRSCLAHAVRNYARARKQDIPSQLDDLPPTLLRKDYAGIQLTDQVDDVVKRLLSLEMASKTEKIKVKTQQLVDKVKRGPDDTYSPEVRIAILTSRIRNYQEHLHIHPKDKANKRRMLMAIDKRKKLLKNLRLTHWEAFENVCTQLGIEYTFPPEYYRRATRRWLAKKALCLKVFQETKRLREAGLLKKKGPTRTTSQEKQGTPV
ncbi:28S ribosomal protein S15, mitochondrial [Spea bombifrons]|uniref:28S ribosomal protein S15, mitochondrial n=1 Tax=Spea bombifrons TaxID=233779 RepID=UPI002349601F|nr:28S ribosomal protein S15, mitochondrial [Spea bombifrons]